MLSFEGFSWSIYGPENISATNICFGPYFSYPEMICTINGMYLFTETNFEWDYYSLDGLPVIEGFFQDSETLILITGNGTESDGIYEFDINTGQFSLLYYCINPKFIKYDNFSEKYYTGYENGLLVSDNGASWSDVTYFTGKSCIEMDSYGENLVVAANIASPNVFWSDDAGITWNASNSPIYITQLTFYGNDLFGIFPNNTYSSGLYKSTDLGDSWEIEFWSVYMSDVCYDDYDGELFVSWNDIYADYEGIAMYEPGNSTAGLTFFNNGLPNTSINRIKYKPVIDAYYAFVCTDTGVYSYLFVGIQKNFFKDNISLFPNPVKDEMIISLKSSPVILSMEIYNNHGQRVDKMKFENGFFSKFETTWDKGNLPAGIYYLVINNGEEKLSKKFIIL